MPDHRLSNGVPHLLLASPFDRFRLRQPRRPEAPSKDDSGRLNLPRSLQPFRFCLWDAKANRNGLASEPLLLEPFIKPDPGDESVFGRQLQPAQVLVFFDPHKRPNRDAAAQICKYPEINEIFLAVGPIEKIPSHIRKALFLGIHPEFDFKVVIPLKVIIRRNLIPDLFLKSIEIRLIPDAKPCAEIRPEEQFFVNWHVDVILCVGSDEQLSTDLFFIFTPDTVDHFVGPELSEKIPAAENWRAKVHVKEESLLRSFKKFKLVGSLDHQLIVIVKGIDPRYELEIIQVFFVLSFRLEPDSNISGVFELIVLCVTDKKVRASIQG